MPLSSVQQIHVIGGKGLHIPQGGWTARTFADHGTRMIQTLVRAAKVTQRKAIPMVSALARDIFNTQLKRIIRRVEQSRQHHRLGIKSVEDDTILLSMAQEEELWKEAIDHVMKTSGIEIVTTMTPPVQSVMAQGYSRTTYLLGEKVEAQISGDIARQSRDIAAQLTSVNDTTRKQIVNAVEEAVQKQMTVVEASAYIEKKVGTIFGNRSLTIARTELNRAWTQGSAISYKQSPAVTRVSVIGCEARELKSPHYKGESTCNYPDLPVAEMDAFLEVGFHPNHTGTLVPSGFKSDEADSE